MKKTLIALFCVAIMVCLAFSVSAASADIKATATTDKLIPGEEVTVKAVLQETATFKVGGLKAVVDSSVFEVVSGEWAMISGAMVMGNFDMSKNNGILIALEPFTVNSGVLFTLKLKVKNTAKAAASTVSFESNFQDANGNPVNIPVTAVTFTCPHTSASAKNDENNHWNECGVCLTVFNVTAHIFDNACDKDCNGGCGFTRVTSHTPATAWQKDTIGHWHNCANCDIPLTKTNHSFDNGCDTTCNDGCGFTRPTSHSPENAWQTDDINHWHNCSKCRQPANKTAHTFDNACDTTCNGGCGFTRSITHDYATAWSKDGTKHWHECNECHAKRDEAKHTYDNKCDTTCNDGCGFNRTSAHTPEAVWQRDNTKHWHNCSDCGQPVNAAAHTFDNACDTTCNGGCGFTRTTTHDYSTAWSTNGTKHWHECKDCYAKKDEATHSGGTATCKEKAKCTYCNTGYGELDSHKETEKAEAEYLVSKADCINKAVYQKSCERCGAELADTFSYGVVDANNHVDKEPVIKNAEQATCTAPGFDGDKYCAGCDVKLADGEPIPAGHKIKKVEAKPAECTENGNIEYYECEGSCGKLYKDAEATTEIAKADTVVKGIGHSIKKVEKVDSTIEKTGTEEHYKCETCEKLYKDAEGKTEITDPDTLIIPKMKPAGTPQGGFDKTIIVVAVIALVGSGAAIYAVVRKKAK